MKTNYVDNDHLENILHIYNTSQDQKEKDAIYQELFIVFNNMSKQIAFIVMKKTKFFLDKYVLEDLVSVGTIKAMGCLDKFDKTHQTNGNDQKKLVKAFNFYTTVIKNEQIQELMKEDRKTWFRKEEKMKVYKQKFETKHDRKLM